MVNAIAGSTATTAASAGTSGATVTSAVSGEFDTFLKMLTAQLKNQDPLNPMEGTDFAVQLATFSGVEQQAQTNKLLQQLIQQQGGGGLSQTAAWIGKEARTTAPVWFGNQALTLDIAPDPRADDVALVTHDARGNEVSRELIGPGAGQIDWFGRDAMGNKLPDGQYSFVIESLRAGEVIAETEVGAYARIVEAEVGENGVDLVFEGGASAPASEVMALRAN